MRVMGVDPGLTRCGLSVIEGGTGRRVIALDVDVVRTPSDEPLHRRLLTLRRAEPALHVGAWAPVDAPEGVIAFDRIADGQGGAYRVALNLRSNPVEVPMAGSWSVALSTHLDREDEAIAGAVELRPDEGVVLRAG